MIDRILTIVAVVTAAVVVVPPMAFILCWTVADIAQRLVG